MKSDAEVIRETVEYLCSLPNRSNLTMYQAVKKSRYTSFLLRIRGIIYNTML